MLNRLERVTPAIVKPDWNRITQIFRQVYCARGRIIVRGRLVTSNTQYFGKPDIGDSLTQGIGDGFLALFKVIRVHLDVDVGGHRPTLTAS